MNAIIVSDGKVVDDILELLVPLVCLLLYETPYNPGGEVKTPSPYFSDSCLNLRSHPHHSSLFVSTDHPRFGRWKPLKVPRYNINKQKPALPQSTLFFTLCFVHCVLLDD